jgi:hypothetical protein
MNNHSKIWKPYDKSALNSTLFLVNKESFVELVNPQLMCWSVYHNNAMNSSILDTHTNVRIF